MGLRRKSFKAQTKRRATGAVLYFGARLRRRFMTDLSATNGRANNGTVSGARTKTGRGTVCRPNARSCGLSSRICGPRLGVGRFASSAATGRRRPCVPGRGGQIARSLAVSAVGRPVTCGLQARGAAASMCRGQSGEGCRGVSRP